jgi:hypothetical protein
VAAWRHNQKEWTLVGLTPLPDAPIVLLLEEDWTQSASALREIARNLLSGPSPLAQNPIGDAAHDLARELAEVTGVAQVCDLVLQHVARAVPCRLATFAVPTERGDLSIIATHGYPLALTEHPDCARLA